MGVVEDRKAASAGKEVVSDRVMLSVFGAAICLGASLVFLVQPMAAKMILPILGGSPAVWNTSMVFFQAALPARAERKGECGSRDERREAGDAKRPRWKYDLIILDAFSSDAIPMHLMTCEAARTYMWASSTRTASSPST